MIEITRKRIPDDHPIRGLFHTLTERGFEQLKLHDEDTIEYISDLLTDFVDVKNARPMTESPGTALEILQMLNADESLSPETRRDYYKHIGDWTLFNLGLYPESLTYGRHTVSPDYYAERGRRSYYIAAGIDASGATVVLRKLSDQFEKCVAGLNWVKLYINDPFYQYVFREFGVT